MTNHDVDCDYCGQDARKTGNLCSNNKEALSCYQLTDKNIEYYNKKTKAWCDQWNRPFEELKRNV